MKKRRGFTMVEVVVSMLLLGVMIVAVFSTVQVSMKLTRQNRIEQSAIHEIENLVECYKILPSPKNPLHTDENALKLYFRGRVEDSVFAAFPQIKVYYDSKGETVSKEEDAAFFIQVNALSPGENGGKRYQFLAKNLENKGKTIYEYVLLV